MKYGLLLMLAVVVWWFLGRERHQVSQRSASPPRPAPPTQENMVLCAHCGVYLPQTQAVSGRGGFFCDEAHRFAHEAQG